MTTTASDIVSIVESAGFKVRKIERLFNATKLRLTDRSWVVLEDSGRVGVGGPGSRILIAVLGLTDGMVLTESPAAVRRKSLTEYQTALDAAFAYTQKKKRASAARDAKLKKPRSSTDKKKRNQTTKSSSVWVIFVPTGGQPGFRRRP